MKPATLETGRWAEDVASRYLNTRGLREETRNYRCRAGEIDLIMRERGTLVFVEVRFRRDDGFGGAAASVGTQKQRRLTRAAQHYLLARGLTDPDCRFDVVSISGEHSGPHIEWIQNAFP